MKGDEGLGEQWLEVWHQLSSYVNPWGVSQNLILWELLPWQGIPAGNWRPHPCHGHSRGPPPLDLKRQRGNTHASLLPTLSSQWVTGPQTDGQFVFGWFWVTFSPVVSGRWANSERSRTAVVWLHAGMCHFTVCAYRVKPCFAASHHTKVMNGLWCNPQSIWGCPRHPAAFC